MDAGSIAIVAIGVVLALAVLWVGFALDRRAQRARSAAWMRSWSIRNRVLGDLFRRWQGPLRLQDQRPSGGTADISPRARRARKRRRGAGSPPDRQL